MAYVTYKKTMSPGSHRTSWHNIVVSHIIHHTHYIYHTHSMRHTHCMHHTHCMRHTHYIHHTHCSCWATCVTATQFVMSHITHHTSHVAHNTSCITHHTPHTTHDTWHITRSNESRHTPRTLPPYVMTHIDMSHGHHLNSFLWKSSPKKSCHTCTHHE